jgi:glutaredoxin
VREFLSGRMIPFVDRNVRQSVAAREELQERADSIVVPQLFWNEHHIVGFDPEALDKLALAFRAAAA